MTNARAVLAEQDGRIHHTNTVTSGLHKARGQANRCYHDHDHSGIAGSHP